MDNLPPAELLIALREALQAAQLQLEYLDERFPTGTTPPAIAKVEAALRASLFAEYPSDTIERLEARVKEAEDERDEAVNWSAIVDRHGCDGFDALGDAWLAMEGVQRMHKAVSSVFAKYANDEMMTRFREHMTAIMHQAFVEGCLVGVRAETASNLTKEGS